METRGERVENAKMKGSSCQICQTQFACLREEIFFQLELSLFLIKSHFLELSPALIRSKWSFSSPLSCSLGSVGTDPVLWMHVFSRDERSPPEGSAWTFGLDIDLSCFFVIHFRRQHIFAPSVPLFSPWVMWQWRGALTKNKKKGSEIKFLAWPLISKCTQSRALCRLRVPL